MARRWVSDPRLTFISAFLCACVCNCFIASRVDGMSPSQAPQGPGYCPLRPAALSQGSTSALSTSPGFSKASRFNLLVSVCEPMDMIAGMIVPLVGACVESQVDLNYTFDCISVSRACSNSLTQHVQIRAGAEAYQGAIVLIAWSSGSCVYVYVYQAHVLCIASAQKRH